MAKYIIDNSEEPIDFSAKGTERTLQNVKNLLMCNMGEVPLDRMRGFDRALLDLPLDDFEEELLPEVDRILEWEPDATADFASAEPLDDGTYLVSVVVDVTEG